MGEPRVQPFLQEWLTVSREPSSRRVSLESSLDFPLAKGLGCSGECGAGCKGFAFEEVAVADESESSELNRGGGPGALRMATIVENVWK